MHKEVYSLEREVQERHDDDGDHAEDEYGRLPGRHQPPPTVKLIVALEPLVVSLRHEQAVLHHHQLNMKKKPLRA